MESSWAPDGSLLKAVEGLVKAVGASWEALGRLLGGSWWALGGFQGASWTKDRHSYKFLAIFEKTIEILGSHLGDVLGSKIVFFEVTRGYPKRS